MVLKDFKHTMGNYIFEMKIKLLYELNKKLYFKNC